MLLRLRSRDGLERIEVDDGANLSALKAAINAKLAIPLDDMLLSKQPGLLTSKEPYSFRDLAINDASLRSQGVSHGDMVYLLYSFERQVEPAVRPAGRSKPFGVHMTLNDVMAKVIKIERQEKPLVSAISFDRNAANVFQSYLQGAFNFSIKRGGLLYGNVDDDKTVKVDFIYEPPQEGSSDKLQLQRHTPEEQQVDLLAQLLGYRKVGFIFCQSVKAQKAAAESDYIINTDELIMMAAMQVREGRGEHCTTALVTLVEEPETGPQVHFEAFQCSDLAVRLVREGWVVARDPVDGVSRMVNPKEPELKQPVMLNNRDTDEVDNDWFLCPVSIRDHDGRLTTSFPVENRLTPQGRTELREHLKRMSSRPYVERLSDFHLLLWLAKQPNLDPNDMALLCEAVREHRPVLEGYRVIIDSIAGISQ
ncbi:hypothetical protein VOLCADRAFT_69322 [Volvox carteri f. nagariensis]|uniref:MPN domain-containing protein n=1 Tax=Volvox carteri f. nagariensis TaxID=3068 RepID=D8UI34_VOLCA|nr:uncharacterized protein VOLCADRAFT_69322 [Volvox carteri f. nagariensis]EFJ40602.1 hypothetical protein VOLCADRAFT_69322 [Volvox carteri f. nagariensis]|eukprot:XP_002958309.1 hypothetical protein VOLCADRAFT_69322 [Volvox carteri f. nagariensis]